MEEKGTLYLCATPLGNLKDITLRVLEVLKEVDLIAVEDTRRTVKLLNHYDIKTPMISYHEHNKESRGREIMECLQEGKKIALAADAGTPGISDPGYELIRDTIEKGIEVISLPGPCAAVTAVVVSGFPIKRFAFYGFLSNKKKDRKRELEGISQEDKTVVIYEAPHRLLKTLKELAEFMENREAALCRELTKVHEEVKRGTIKELISHYEVNPLKGEITLAIKPPAREEEVSSYNLGEGVREVKELKEEGLREGEAVKRIARYFKLPRRELYKKVIEDKEKEEGKNK
ncbi:MAG: 16S rRNA (cytidine(1402)-2'-O)-methyltransferase [Candidatus Syntrophonatronum acetioxidans]|uniref:Ribosomal RNA small subunit methyltransferase I n=1 Tax=Candidatus Syntrophonatronum acetioxidans TaxID=1795816 RepID=A0A424YEL5_9FIRM|nr:MAG: 16S rRNA (cytidine(1402)-2'-O)-methyltransferase [Candidatus Syntrophonatronum acetioxidans]